jgi:beta-galactosidase
MSKSRRPSSSPAAALPVRRAAAAVEGLEDRRLMANTVPAALGGAERASLDLSNNWKFIKQDVANAQSSSVSDASWDTVSLPHTWNGTDGANGKLAGEDPDGDGDFYYRGATWYRNRYTLSKVWAGRRVFINVGAASINAQVYVNGQLVGTHKGDYSGFTFDITNALKGTQGQESIIAIRVDNTKDLTLPGYQGDFTKFGGLTRGVELFATNRLHINSAASGSSGVKVTYYDVSRDSATLSFNSSMRNDWGGTRNYSFRQSLVDAEGNVVAQTSKSLSTTKNKSLTIYQNFTIENPRLWNGTTDPYLYTLYTQVDQGGSILDTISTKIGIRSIETDSTGLKLNGEYVELKGVNLHDDKAGKGTAMDQGDRERDIKLILEMGANAVRFSHMQVDQAWYDLCDEKGLLVWTEVQLWGTHIQGTQAFADNSAEALRELIRQNYNHPSIAYWGLFNEIPDNATTRSLITNLQNVAKAEDPIRETIGTSFSDYSAQINTIPDVTTFNRYYGWYSYPGSRYTDSTQTRLDAFGTWLDSLKTAQPGRSLGMGEYGAGANINHHTNDPKNAAPPSDPNSNVSAQQPEEYQAYLHEETWEQYKASDAKFGVFLWQFADSGNDGRNEAGLPGINTKGLMTYDRRYAKDAFYYYKAQWSDSPVLYLTSKRFTDRTDDQTYVKVYSNLGANVELLVNGVSLGTRNDGDGVLEWDNVTLNGGANTILVRATVNGKTYTETATWTLNASGGGLAAQSLATTAAAATSSSKSSSATKDLFADDELILA